MSKKCKVVEISKKGMGRWMGIPSSAHNVVGRLKQNSDFLITDSGYYYRKYSREKAQYIDYIKLIYKDTRMFIQVDFILFLDEHNLWHKLKNKEAEVLFQLSKEDYNA